MPCMVLLVAERGLEMHACTESEWICIQHGVVVAQEVARIAVSPVGSFSRGRVEIGYTMGSGLSRLREAR